jgi:hypothetical protein
MVETLSHYRLSAAFAAGAAAVAAILRAVGL